MAELLSERDDPLLRGAVSFVYRSLMHDSALDAFFTEYVPHFPPHEEEHRLEHTEIYQEFEALMELSLSGSGL